MRRKVSASPTPSLWSKGVKHHNCQFLRSYKLKLVRVQLTSHPDNPLRLVCSSVAWNKPDKASLSKVRILCPKQKKRGSICILPFPSVYCDVTHLKATPTLDDTWYTLEPIKTVSLRGWSWLPSVQQATQGARLRQ